MDDGRRIVASVSSPNPKPVDPKSQIQNRQSQIAMPSADHSPIQPPSPTVDELAAFALGLRRRGLATPALILLHGLRPLRIVASQGLLLLEPLAPGSGWQTRLAQMSRDLQDDATWTRLENLLHSDVD
jgi:hypothetical protein